MTIFSKLSKPKHLPLILRIAGSLIFVYILPTLLYRTDSPWLAFSYTKEQSLFEYLGFAGTFCLFINGFIEWKGWRTKPIENKLFTVAFFLFSGFQLILFSELSRKGHDYLAYQESVRALLTSQSPYSSPYTALHPYIYPPLLVQIMTFYYRGVSWGWFHLVGRALTESEVFSSLFYTYQFVQLVLTLLCYSLTYLFAIRLKIKPIYTAALISGLYILNLPLFRNLTQNQVNLWILLSILLAILWIERNPFGAGAMIAFGTHLKIYPVIQLIPWLLKKKWRAITGFVITFAIILWLETSGARTFQLWQDFFGYLGKIEKGVALRNNSISSLAYNLSQLVFSNQLEVVQTVTPLLTVIFTTLLVVWVILRGYQRFRIQGQAPGTQMLGLMMDCIFLMFFISPSVWDHHLVSAIPLIVWAVARFPQERLPKTALAAICIFLVPTFDVFFFSFIRLIGLLLLFYNTNPIDEIAESFPAFSQRLVTQGQGSGE